ncbi:MAG TPA: SOS response-associated peptidase, partial [Chthonomonadales bacterium]|nr:SOS response-associated peptidase [Chthonomonadales bacterium]
LINARSESVLEKPSFRSAFRKRRCLIPSDGFYEWKKEGAGKQPYLIGMKKEDLFGIAGLWETWNGPNGPMATFTILTTSANELVSHLHDRMPVILSRERFADWLSPKEQDTGLLMSLLRPCPSEEMRAYAVSKAVNSTDRDSADLINPVKGDLSLSL